MTPDRYVGTELDLFATCRHWKRYALGRLRKYASGRVLEVGAGIGANTPYLLSSLAHEWICLEPDASLAARISQRIDAGTFGTRVRSVAGTLRDLAGTSGFDAIFYIDVLEHIKDDRGELTVAASLLNPGGWLVVLAPAHGRLYSPFDHAVGHFRRYNRHTLSAVAPPDLHRMESFYLDSAGLLASAANKLLLKQSVPSARQIAFWDRVLVPISRILDPLLCGMIGKTIVTVWKKSSDCDAS